MRYAGPVMVRLKQAEPHATPDTMIYPNDHFIMTEVDALKFLALIKAEQPALFKHFAILDREPDT